MIVAKAREKKGAVLYVKAYIQFCGMSMFCQNLGPRRSVGMMKFPMDRHKIPWFQTNRCMHIFLWMIFLWANQDTYHFNWWYLPPISDFKDGGSYIRNASCRPPVIFLHFKLHKTGERLIPDISMDWLRKSTGNLRFPHLGLNTK